ncbi:5'-3' exoribonuclease 1 [Gryllus bimaculatus]|nr:5'-3' exoribonuclease 1 [Gryllus bimaculatus]
MGVPKFFRWISERYPCLSEFVREYQIPTFDNLYLDMNGIIHTCSHPNDFDPHFRISEEKIFKDIFHYIEVLFRMIRPQKLFFMAVDGVAPRAKMNQQRGRRFRSAKEAEILEKKAQEKGETLPTEARFDSNCITPGTVFMARLHEQLKYFVTYKVSTDPLWQKCKVILSGHETPGEGEHKIMDYIRCMKSQSDYDPNTRHCLYGLDADLIMLGLCSHEPHFSLLREEVLMGFLVGNDFIPPLPDMHIANGALPILYEAYIQVLPTLDGYINEGGTLNLKRFQKYMEKLSAFDINQFRETYADLKYFEGKTGRKLGSKERTVYKNKDGEENKVATLQDIAALVKEAGQENPVNSREEAQSDGPNTESPKSDGNGAKLGGSGKRVLNRELEALIKETEDLLLGSSALDDFDDNEEDEDDDDDDDDDLDEDDDDEEECNFVMEFDQHKRDYYMNKLEYSIVNEEVMRSQAEGYVRAIQWNLNYYYNGVCSWSWFYPHHYAPYISDVKNFSELKLEFDMGKPFLPFQQLLAVLPAASKKLLPEPYQKLMINTDSPIISYYPSQFKTDLNGKKQEWEAVVLIPFIDETVLLEAMEPIKTLLTPDEQKRNSHGPALVYEYTEDDLGHYAAPEYFPPISHHHASVVELHREELFVDPCKLIKGLCPGAKLDVYFPGFPTFKHIKYCSSLEKKKVKVFEMPSRGDNMIVHILNESKPDVKQVATDLLGKSVFVDWPHLLEAKVIAVVSREKRYALPLESNTNSSAETCEIIEEEVKGNLAAVWTSQKNAIQERYMNRLGVDIGTTGILLQCLPIVGRQFAFGKQGRITLDKHWSKTASAFALQATVKDISVHDPSFAEFSSVEEVFPVGTRVFLLGLPHYGYMGEVRDYEEGAQRSGRVKITVTVTMEPNLAAAHDKHLNFRVNYMPGSSAAQRLSISPHLLSRITGTIYIVHGEWADGTENKTNIGLNLKFNKKNEEIPGYTKKDNGMWLYSLKAVDLVASYMQQFPELFDYLSANTGNDVFNEADPYYIIERQVCGAAVLDPEIVQEIERTVDMHYQSKNSVKTVSMQVKPHLLFKPSMQIGSLPPDADASYLLFDRVMNIRESYTVPLGWKGTIIGIHKREKDADTMYDVVFDKPFAGGMSFNCSANRGYRVPRYALINLSYGERLAHEKCLLQEKSDKKITTQSSGKDVTNRGTYTFSPAWNSALQPQQQQQQQQQEPQLHQQQRMKPQMPSVPTGPPVQRSQNIVSSHPNSAFASWRSQGQGIIPSTNQQSFVMRSTHTSQTPPQANAKLVNQSWRQRPTPPAVQTIQRQPPQRTQVQPQLQVSQQQQQHGQIQMFLNKAPNSVAQPQQSEQMAQKPPQPSGPLLPKSSPNEFQLMWNELQGLGKPGSTGETPKSAPPPSSSQQATSQFQVNDSGTEILKKMLRITEVPTEKPQPVSSQQTMKQVSVQEMFEHARANESKSASFEENSYTIQLLKMFQLQGQPLPRYAYTEKEDRSIVAQVFLPNTCSFTGSSASSKEQAGENAAKVALSKLTSERNTFHGNTNNVNSVGLSGARPLTNNLPSPPQQWCWPQNQQPRSNRFHQQDFHQNKQEWRARNDHVGSFGNTTNSWMRQQPQVAVSQQQYSPYVVQQQIRTPPRTNWRDESRQGSQFVPLQAVKQQRSKSGTQQQQQQQPQQQQQQQKQKQQKRQQSQFQQLQQLQQQPQQLQLQPQWHMKSKQEQNHQGPLQSLLQQSEKMLNPDKSPGQSSKEGTNVGETSSKENLPKDSNKVNMKPESSKGRHSGTPKPRQKKSRIAANFGGVKVAEQ